MASKRIPLNSPGQGYQTARMALILAVLSIVSPLLGLPPIVGLILAIIALKKSRDAKKEGFHGPKQSMAFIVSALSLAFNVIIILVVLGVLTTPYAPAA